VESITQQGPTSSHWVVKVGGVTREFDTEIAERQVDKSAEEFKDLIESRGSETGAWRGDIN
jgi:hypothetical protein